MYLINEIVTHRTKCMHLLSGILWSVDICTSNQFSGCICLRKWLVLCRVGRWTLLAHWRPVMVSTRYSAV